MPFFKRLLTYSTIAAVILTTLLLLARLHWFLEMLTHFRLPCALGFLTLAILLLLTKSYKQVIAVSTCLFLQLIPLSHHYLPFTKDDRAGSGPQLKVITFNVLTSNPNKDQVLTFLKSENADLVCLQETSTEWLTALKPLKALYPHSIEYPRSDNFGLLILSRHPITSHQLDNNPSLATPYLRAKIDWLGNDLTIINAHPMPPMRKNAAQSNHATLALIQRHSTQTQNPLIVVGDFNHTAYSHRFNPLKKTLYDSSQGRGYPATWRRGHPLLALPIDHILYSKDLVCLERTIGERHGSDHSPIIATLQARSDSE